VVAVILKIERGRLELDAPIQRYVPMYPEKPWPITCRQILGHLSGISSLPEALDTALLYEPGTAFQYGSTAYTLLARAIESVSGLDFLTCVRRNVLEPAGMAHTDADAGSRIVPNRARGYAWDEEASVFRIADDADTRDHLAGGGFCGTADDIVRFGLALHEGRLLGAKACEEMWTRLRLTGGRQTRYGLGWFAWNYRGEREVAHGGKYNGISNMFSLRPASGVVVVLLTNRHGLNSSHMHALTRQLGDIAMT